MSNEKNIVVADTSGIVDLPEQKPPSRRFHLEPSSPSIRSIARVVIITLLILFVAGSVETIIKSVAPLFFLIILSVFFAYLIDPIVKLIRRPFKQRSIEKWMPRWLAIVISYIFVFSVFGLAIANIAPRVVDQAKEFGTNLPAYGQSLQTRGNELMLRYDRLKISDDVKAEIEKKVTDIGAVITAAVGNFVLISVTFLPWFLLVPILAFFFLKDVNLFRLAILRMFPAGPLRYRAEVVMADVNTTLAAYTRAQLISCVIIGLICTSGFIFSA